MNNTIFLEATPPLAVYGHGWLINLTDIRPGFSAICGENRLAFFAIHHLALCVISVSFVSSLVVIKSIHAKWRDSTSKLDFPIRFPLYLAIADNLWGISHFTDHMYLVTTETYPSAESVKEALSINLWFFFGYQQLMHASVSGYTYLRVVHRKKLKLGKWEWKLHLSWCTFLFLSIILFYFCDSFGNTGYWMAHDATTLNGQILGVVIALTSSFNAFCTTFGYYTIKSTVDTVKARLLSNKINSNHHKRQNSTASQCLTTYVWVAAILYCPLALLLWVNVLFQIVLNSLEPLSSFLIVIVANSSGWANAYGYFHNEQMKKDKENGKNSSSQVNSTEKSFDSNSSSTNV